MGYRTLNKSSDAKWLWLLVIVPAIGGCQYWFIGATKETVTARIVKTERIVTGSGDHISSKYLVFTEGEVFENTDELLAGKWNSSDLIAKLHEGETYKLTVYGYRVPYLSMYRNIIEVD